MVLIPLFPDPLGKGLDASYVYGFNLARAQGLRIGSDWVFPYGPLAWTQWPDPGLSALWPVACIELLRYACCLWVVWRWRDRVASTLWVAVMAFVLFPSDRPWFTLLGLFALYLAEGGWITAVLVSVGTAFVHLVKFNDGVAAYALLGAVLWHRGGRARWLIALPPAVVALMVDHQFYWRASLELMVGYPEAMAIPGPAWQVATAWLAIALIAAVAAGPGWQRIALPHAAVLLLAFLFYKHGVVRQDGHANFLHGKLAMTALLLAPLISGWRIRAVHAFAAVSLVAAGWIAHANSDEQPVEALRRLTLRRVAADAGRWLRPDPAWAANLRETEANLADRRWPGALAGAIEPAPFQIDRARATGVVWAPRPVPQSYTVYTAWLDLLNRDHIASDRAAPRVVLEELGLDRRQQLWDDPASMVEMINRYDATDFTGPGAAVLTRRARPRFGPSRAIGSVAAGWGDRIDVPPAGPGERVVMHARIERSWEGAARTLLLRLTPAYVEGGYDTGPVRYNRVVRRTLVNGALADLPRSLDELLRHFNAGGPPERLRWLRFVTARPAEYEPVIRIEWRALPELDQSTN